MRADYSINKGKVRIRPMLSSDISTYVFQKDLAKEYGKKTRKRLEKELKEDERNDNLFKFTIEYENNIVGAIMTQAFGEHLCDGIVVVDIPDRKYRFLCRRIKSIFVQFLRKNYLYDDIVFAESLRLNEEKLNTLNKIPIACWKTRKTSV